MGEAQFGASNTSAALPSAATETATIPKLALSRKAYLNFWQAESSGKKLPIPNFELQRSAKLQAQIRSARRFPRRLFFWVWGLGVGTSLEIGVRCLVIRSTAAQRDAPQAGSRYRFQLSR